MIILLTLTLGGALFPSELMGPSFGKISSYMLPSIILKAMEYPYLGLSPYESIGRLLGIVILACVFFTASMPFLKPRRRV